MDDVNVLKEQIKVLEIQLSDSNKKLSLNRQYSSTLEDKISEMDSSRPVYKNVPIIIVLLLIIIILCKKVLVLSKCKKDILFCDRFIKRWLYAWY